SGDERYVRRVISALPAANADTDARANPGAAGVGSFLVGGMARWSLMSNASQHPRVLQICREAIEKMSEDRKPVLERVIADAAKAAMTEDDDVREGVRMMNERRR